MRELSRPLRCETQDTGKLSESSGIGLAHGNIRQRDHCKSPEKSFAGSSRQRYGILAAHFPIGRIASEISPMGGRNFGLRFFSLFGAFPPPASMTAFRPCPTKRCRDPLQGDRVMAIPPDIWHIGQYTIVISFGHIVMGI
jgi:hypothetical protein